MFDPNGHPMYFVLVRRVTEDAVPVAVYESKLEAETARDTLLAMREQCHKDLKAITEAYECGPKDAANSYWRDGWDRHWGARAGRLREQVSRLDPTRKPTLPTRRKYQMSALIGLLVLAFALLGLARTLVITYRALYAAWRRFLALTPSARRRARIASRALALRSSLDRGGVL